MVGAISSTSDVNLPENIEHNIVESEVGYMCIMKTNSIYNKQSTNKINTLI